MQQDPEEDKLHQLNDLREFVQTNEYKHQLWPDLTKRYRYAYRQARKFFEKEKRYLPAAVIGTMLWNLFCPLIGAQHLAHLLYW